MSREPPCCNPDAASADVLMEYLKRASPDFVAAELDRLGLLEAADRAAAATLDKVAAQRATLRGSRLPARQSMSAESVLSNRLVAMVALAMCATILALAQTRAVNSPWQDDRSQLMQLAGPTPEW